MWTAKHYSSMHLFMSFQSLLGSKWFATSGVLESACIAVFMNDFMCSQLIQKWEFLGILFSCTYKTLISMNYFHMLLQTGSWWVLCYAVLFIAFVLLPRMESCVIFMQLGCSLTACRTKWADYSCCLMLFHKFWWFLQHGAVNVPGKDPCALSVPLVWHWSDVEILNRWQYFCMTPLNMWQSIFMCMVQAT